MSRLRNLTDSGIKGFERIPSQAEAPTDPYSLDQMDRLLADMDLSGARRLCSSMKANCPRRSRVTDQRRPTVNDSFVTTGGVNGLITVPAGNDIIADLIADVGIINGRALQPDQGNYRLQLLNRTITGFGIEIVATVNESVPDPPNPNVLVFNEALSEQVERIMGSLELRVFGDDSTEEPILASTPLYQYDGGILLDPDLWLRVMTDRFHFSLVDPGNMRPLIQGLGTTASLEIRVSAIVEDVYPVTLGQIEKNIGIGAVQG